MAHRVTLVVPLIVLVLIVLALINCVEARKGDIDGTCISVRAGKYLVWLATFLWPLYQGAQGQADAPGGGGARDRIEF